ncbi:MAG: M24 family metallopeptidase [Ramlibacter sp.]
MAIENTAASLRRGNWLAGKLAGMLGQWLDQHGSDGWFHRPFAWFGGHASFDGYTTYDHFHPGERKLVAGESVILDVSPIVDGYVGDIGYPTSVGPCPDLERANRYLRGLRARLPALFGSSLPLNEIWQRVDDDIRAAGYALVAVIVWLAVPARMLRQQR